jgi:small subunit ribosomal protein S20
VANVQSAEKRNRQRLRRRQRNLAQLSTVRHRVKRVNASLAAKDGKAAEALKEAIRAIDKAAQKGAIKKETASRKISRLTKAVAAAK